MHCMYCNNAIPEGRAEFLTETGRPSVCISCSSEQPKLTLMEYAHKTAGYLVIVGRGQERLALSAYRRTR